MRKKGFTLVEMMGVIIILGILILITVPVIRKVVSSSKQKLYEAQITNIKDSLKNWAVDNNQVLPESDGESLIVTLEQLKRGGYIEFEVKNPKNNKCFDNNMLLKITKVKKNYDYSIDETTIKETDNCEVDTDAPSILLIGSNFEYVEVNSIYTDKGVIAKDKDGNDITSNVSTKITGSGNVVNTSNIGNEYIITYTIENNGKTATIIRTVKIVDTIAPILVIPGNITIDKSVSSFDVMDGVSATDNSGETITVSASSNINLVIPGKYTITYTATDSSGNVATERRLVTIKEEDQTTTSNAYISSDDSCATTKYQKCDIGTKVSVQVNDEETYDFYVIKDYGYTTFTLIMADNLVEDVNWINRDDYVSAGGTSLYWNNEGKSDFGPRTAVKELEDRTRSWTNIPTIDYIYLDENDLLVYQPFESTGIRARLITKKEADSLYSEERGSWAYTGEAYWTSSAYYSDSFSPSDGYLKYAWYVSPSGKKASAYPTGFVYRDEPSIGIRPVIEISK